MSEDVLEGDEGPGQRVEFVDSGVNVVETRAMLPHLLAVCHHQEEPTVHLKALPVGGSRGLQGRNRQEAKLEAEAWSVLICQLPRSYRPLGSDTH